MRIDNDLLNLNTDGIIIQSSFSGEGKGVSISDTRFSMRRLRTPCG
ncbi:MAG: hypothetical protein GX571_10335 [Lentisphaerae bacterium]|jgi:hypothetical protein|nr:hypothetical protein [Lentisphaerota bacterium]